MCRTKDGYLFHFTNMPHHLHSWPKRYIFGGFNPLPWTTVPQSSIEKIKQAIEEKGQPFIFSLVNPHSTPPCRMLPLDSSGEVNFCPSNSNLGPVWGTGTDMRLSLPQLIFLYSCSFSLNYRASFGLGDIWLSKQV